MNRDFHYYGTYGAARLAGFDATEATVIAHSAQYVDDSTRDRQIDQKKFAFDFQPVPTFHTMVNDLVMNRPGDVELRLVWIPFHFLPGNLSDAKKVKYNGPMSASRLGGTFEYDEKARREFQLMCLPKSDLARDMINDIITNHLQRDPIPEYLLHLIGIRMHVLADTMAHQHFAGVVAWHVNDVIGTVTDMINNRPVPYSYFFPGSELFGPDPGISFDTISFLGHGRMGAVLDYPWLKFEYTPRGLEQSTGKRTIIHNNPAAYLESFRQMYTALVRIRARSTFDFSRPEPLDPACGEVISGILKTPHPFGTRFLNDDGHSGERCRLWEAALGQDQILGRMCGKPRSYDADAWYNEVIGQEKRVQSTDYYRFSKAAIIHRTWVEDELRRYGIDLTSSNLSFPATIPGIH